MSPGGGWNFKGEEQDADWFMYSSNDEDEDVDYPEPAALCEVFNGHYPCGHVFWFANQITKTPTKDPTKTPTTYPSSAPTAAIRSPTSVCNATAGSLLRSE